MSAVQRWHQARVDAAELAFVQHQAALAAAEAERDQIAAAAVPARGSVGSVEDLWGPARFEEANRRRRLAAQARVAEREADMAQALQAVQSARRRLAMTNRLAERVAAAQERLSARRESLNVEDDWRMARARQRPGDGGG